MDGALKISEGSNLAIHALAYLVSMEDGIPTTVTRMAEDLRVSKDHLGKVMQRLVRQGMVNSRRGPKGGFTMAQDPQTIALLQVVEAIDGPMTAPSCLLGKPVCQGGSCVMSGLAAKVHAQVIKVLKETRLSDLPPPVHRSKLSRSAPPLT